MTKFSRLSMAFKAFCFGFMLFFSGYSVFPQSASQSGQMASGSSETEQTSSSENQTSFSATQAPAQNWNWSSQTFDQNQKQPSTFGLFVKMVFALALVLGIAYFALRILKRGSKLSNSDDPFLRHVSHLALSASRSVDVVTILDHAYILGVSDNAVNLVGEITDKELVNSMNLYADKNDSTKRPRTFEDILNIFVPKNQQSKNENIYGSSAWNSSEILRRQRERFNENEGGEE